MFFYLAIAAGGVSHRDMFFENPVKLPFLNVDLPLIGFFVLGPALFLIVHAYTLLHFVLLAGKVGAFHTELQAQIPDEDARTRLRRQLPSDIFVQFLAGPREVRAGAMGFMLRLIAQISLVAGPIALLVFFQLQFLPYQTGNFPSPCRELNQAITEFFGRIREEGAAIARPWLLGCLAADHRRSLGPANLSDRAGGEA